MKTFRLLSCALTFLLIFVASHAAASPIVVLPAGSAWRYSADGTDQGSAWRAVTFNDAAWNTGLAQLGFGDGDEVTTLMSGITTAYFRRTFESQLSGVSSLTVRLLRDDGAVVYINGIEVFRNNMPPGPVTYNTLATVAVGGAEETTQFIAAQIDPNVLVQGLNVVAVEVHQVTVTSGDLSFDLELIADTDTPVNQRPYVQLNEPQNGDVFTAPTNIALRAFAQDQEDGYQLRVEFFDGTNSLGLGEFVATTCPAPYCPFYQLVWLNAPPGSHTLIVRATDSSGASSNSAPVSITVQPDVPPTNVTFVASGSVWKYLDNGSDQGTAWRQVEFNDTTWASGPAQLGYGDGDEATVVNFGPEPANKYITTYFRRTFNVVNAASFTELRGQLLQDDGAAVYLNGAEVFRSNLPQGPITYTTLTTGVGPDNLVVPFSASGNFLREGANVVAVEMHQNSVASSDLSFDLELIGVGGPQPPELPIVNVIATDTDAAESGLLTVVLPGSFSFSRTGDPSDALTAFFTISGTAINGVDYTRITNAVHFTPGQTITSIYIYPLSDNLVEGTETVVVTLEQPACAAVVPPPAGCYRVGIANQATVFIQDANNQRPYVQLNQPRNGDVFTAPTNIVLHAYAEDAEDGYDLTVEFFAGTNRLGVGTFVPSLCPAPYCPYYQLIWSNPPPGNHTLIARATDSLGASSNSAPVSIKVQPREPGTNVTLVANGSVWKYLDNGTDQGTAWRAPAFDDSAWASGPAQLGYGDGDEATVVGFGPDPMNKYVTTYFRRSFHVANAASFSELSGRLLEDDGGVVYLNGVEIFRSNLPAGPILFNTLATGIVGDNQIVDFAAPGSLLQEGLNVLAVEMHQNAVTSSDLSFDLELIGVTTNPPPPNTQPYVQINRPQNGDAFIAPATILLSAYAQDSEDGFTLTVEFFEGDRSLGFGTFMPTRCASPLCPSYDLTWSNVPPGNYVLTARATDSSGAFSNSAPVHISVTGSNIVCVPQLQWQRAFGGTGAETLYTIHQTSDGGYLLGGTSASVPSGNKTSPFLGGNQYVGDMWLVRLDAAGNKLWDKSFGGTGSEHLMVVLQTRDGGIALAGASDSGISGNKTAPNFGGEDFWLVRLDANGNKLWDHSFGGTGHEFLRRCEETPDGGFVLGGYSQSGPDGNKQSPFYGYADYWVVRVDANGNKLWDRSYGGENRDELRGLAPTSDGGFLLGGLSASTNGTRTSQHFGGEDFWVIRLDREGHELWQASFGGTQADQLYDLTGTSDGGFALTGFSNSGIDGNKTSPNLGPAGTAYPTFDFWIVRLDASGNKLWDRTFGGAGSEVPYSIRQMEDGGFVVGGHAFDSEPSGNKTSPNYGSHDFWVVRMDAQGNPLWDLSFGGSNSDPLLALEKTFGGGFIMGGQSHSGADGNKTVPSFGFSDYWVVKLGPDHCDTNAPPRPGTKVWEFASGGVYAPPAVGADGTVYVVGGNPSPKLYALAPTGGTKWAAQLGAHIGGSPAIGADGTIYVGNDRTLRAYSPAGALVWSFAFPATQLFYFISAPAIAHDGTIYAGTGAPDKGLYAFNPNGALKWKFVAAGQYADVYTPVIGTDGTIYVGTYNDRFYALNPDGTKRWDIPMSGYGIAAAVGGDGTIYVVGSIFPNKLFAFAPNGTKKWETPIGSEFSQGSSLPTLAPDGTIYVGCPTDNKLYAFNADGSPKWTFVAGGNVSGASAAPAVDTQGNVYVGLGVQLFAISAAGSQLWSYSTTGGFTAASLTPAGILYVGNAADTTYAFQANAGLAQSPWPMFQRDLRHTGAAPLSTPPNQQPRVAITSPADRSVFDAPASVRIEAITTDPDGYASTVEFFANDLKIGEASVVFIQPPPPGVPIHFAFTWSNAPAGQHRLTARTVDDRGAHALSDPVNIMVREQPSDRELHIVGIYAGRTLDGQWQNHPQGHAAVTVNRPGKRITLFLSAYEPVTWHVTAADGTTLEKVILVGYYPGSIEGVGPEVEIVRHWINYFIGSTLESGQFYRTAPKVRRLTGLEISSFHGDPVPYPAPFVIDGVQDDPRLHSSYPVPTPLSELPELSFNVSFSTGSGVSTVAYTLAGPNDGGDLLPNSNRAVPDHNQRYYYALSDNGLLQIDSASGGVRYLPVPSDLPELSVPMGVAYDTTRQRALLVSLGGEGFLYAYSPAQDRWSVVSSMNGLDLASLTYHASGDALYGMGVTRPDAANMVMYRLNPDGTGATEFRLPLYPWGVDMNTSELVSVGDYLVLLLNPSSYTGDLNREDEESRMYLIEPATGQAWLTVRQPRPIPPNQPPAVSINAPADGAIFTTPASVQITAVAVDYDNYASKVEFFANSLKIGETMIPPQTGGNIFNFTWQNVPPGEYALTAKATDLRDGIGVSPAVNIRVVTNLLPVVQIISPTNRAIFTGPTNIFVRARASDPNGTVVRVEFFEGTNRLGFATQTGTNQIHTLVWSNVAPRGVYSLTVRAIDNQGAAAISEPITIAVVSYPVPPLVTLTVADPNAAEPGTDTAAFRITRTPPANVPLTVYYDIGGTAASGVDYVALAPPGEFRSQVTIPAGSGSIDLVVTPIDDLLVEGTETADIALRQTPWGTIPTWPPAADGYFIDILAPASRVWIADNDPTIACPCDAAWSNHGQYVSCVIHRAWALYRAGEISADQRRAMIRDAILSACGRSPDRLEPVCIHLFPLTREECHRDGLQFVLSGDAPENCILECSEDLVNWRSIEPVSITGWEIACPLEPGVTARFYRVRTASQ